MAIGHSRGRPVGTMDAFLAATALSRDLTLVTRKVADFEHLDVRLINPWRDG
jgi:predicted nucleic acid-binding protein